MGGEYSRKLGGAAIYGWRGNMATGGGQAAGGAGVINGRDRTPGMDGLRAPARTV